MILPPTILLIENNTVMTDLLSEALKNEYQLERVKTGKAGIYRTDQQQYDAILLDLSLEDIPGIDVCRLMRERGVKSPILVVSSSADARSKIALLDMGANDYLTKPFSLGELKARIRAHIRNTPQHHRPMKRVVYSELELNFSTRQVWRQGTAIQLRRKEFALLEKLILQPEVVVSRTALIEHAWEVFNHKAHWTNTMDVHMKHLRDKIDRPYESRMIQTVHGIGYRLVAAEQPATLSA